MVAPDCGVAATKAPDATGSRPALKGTVAGVIDGATLVISERPIRLQGIDPGPPELLGSFAAWAGSRSPMECQEQAVPGLYRCYANNGVDVPGSAHGRNGSNENFTPQGPITGGSSPLARDL